MSEHRQRHHRQEDDDLLEGFRLAGPRAVALRGFFAVTISGSLIAWDLAFTAGAYETVFYHRINQLLVIALVVLLGRLILGAQLHRNRWVTVLFALPAFWLVFRLLALYGPQHPVFGVVEVIMIVVMVLALPLLLWVMARLLAPNYFSLPQRRMKIASVGIIAAIALTGFLVGTFNNHFYTCWNFKIAGDYEPAGCADRSPRD